VDSAIGEYKLNANQSSSNLDCLYQYGRVAE
jgi:hypothetical protein